MRYRSKVVRAVKGMESRTIAKWEKVGWEFVEKRPGPVMRTELQFRRQRRGWFGSLDRDERTVVLAVGGLLSAALVLGLGAVVLGSSGPEPERAPTAAATAHSTSTPSAAPEVSTGQSAASSDAVVGFVQDFVDARAAADVTIAEAVVSVKISGRELRVMFDPNQVGLSRDQFDTINPYNNPSDENESLADFIGSSLMTSEKKVALLRDQLDTIVTSYAGGEVDGTRTIAELETLNGLD